MKTTKMLAILVLSLGLMVCAATISKAADMGTAFTYQGRLMDANSAADGLYDFQFKLFDDPCVGPLIAGPVNEPGLDVIDGYFTVWLDFGNVYDGDARWLEIGVRGHDPCDVNAFTTQSPRQEITPTPYALYAKTAGGDNDWMVVGNDMYSIPSGKVGIGTTSPLQKLHVVGNVIVEGASPVWMELISNFGTDAGINLTTFGPGVNTWEIIRDGASADFLIRETMPHEPFSIDALTIKADGKVGIGTISPSENLVVGTDLGSFGGNRIVVGDDAGDTATGIVMGENTDNRGWLLWSGIYDFLEMGTEESGVSHGNTLVLKQGNVGIRTTSPTSKLDVKAAADGSNVVQWLNQAGLVAGSLISTSGSPSGAGGLKLNDGTGSTKVLISGYSEDSYINSGGNLGIGTTSPTSKLDVKAAADGSNVVQWLNQAGLVAGSLFSASGSPSGAGVLKLNDGTGSTKVLISGYSEDSYINSGGNLGIGTTSPSGKLEITGTSYSSHFYYGSNEDTYIRPGKASGNVIMDRGKVGIGVTDPSEDLDVSGTARLRGISSQAGATYVHVDGNGKLWKIVSSKRYKTNIRDLETDAYKVLKLRPVRFQCKTNGQEDIGLIAEEVEEVLKDLVVCDNEGRPDVVKYDRIALYLLGVVKDQQEKIATLQERLDALENTTQQLSRGKEYEL